MEAQSIFRRNHAEWLCGSSGKKILLALAAAASFSLVFNVRFNIPYVSILQFGSPSGTGRGGLYGQVTAGAGYR